MPRMQQGEAGPSSREVMEPLTDDLIQRCLAVGPWEHNGKPLWHRLLDWAVEPGQAVLFTSKGTLALRS